MDRINTMIPLGELNLTDRFLFDEVLEDPRVHQDMLSIIFGREIPLLEHSETEKEARISPLARSVRMDVFAIDEENTVYNTEMQKKRKTDLAKRSRYYQALIDTGIFEPGVPDYNMLNESFIIMITPFDLFGYGKYQYTFEAGCREVPGFRLEDGATRIFLNTRGENDAEVPKELVDLLHYLECTTDQAAEESGSERIRRIHARVRKVKTNEEVGVRYMQAWEERYFDREEAREEGFAEGKAEGREKGRAEGRAEGAHNKLCELIEKKLQKGKTVREIADALEESEETILTLIEEIKGK